VLAAGSWELKSSVRALASMQRQIATGIEAAKASDRPNFFISLVALRQDII
jgi:hypothetical protein